MLYLYTEQFFLWPRLKNLIKILLRRQYRGPQGVVASLERGLKELGVQYSINKKPSQLGATACVLTGTKVLKWAVKRKHFGVFSHIVAGPDVGIPDKPDHPICSREVDAYVLPSQWVADFVISLNPVLKSRTHIWSAGVETLPNDKLSEQRKGFILYYKSGDKKVFFAIKDYLQSKNIPVSVLWYGKHARQKFLDLLTKSEAVVFFSNSESQGLALNEAWMAGVATLVWSGGGFCYRNKQYPSSSAPFLSPESGLFFSNEADFKTKLDYYLLNKAKFTPREYHLAKFTNRVTTEKYLDIIKKLI